LFDINAVKPDLGLTAFLAWQKLIFRNFYKQQGRLEGKYDGTT